MTLVLTSQILSGVCFTHNYIDLGLKFSNKKYFHLGISVLYSLVYYSIVSVQVYTISWNQCTFQNALFVYNKLS